MIKINKLIIKTNYKIASFGKQKKKMMMIIYIFKLETQKLFKKIINYI